MKTFDNKVAKIHYQDNNALERSINNLCSIIINDPGVLISFKDADEDVSKALSSEGFELYPTVQTTTLFYDPGTDCFFKILHPLCLKNRIIYYLKNKAKAIYLLSEKLHARGLKIPKVLAYGYFKNGHRPFFVTNKVKGDRLYDTLIREKQKIALTDYQRVLDEVANFHKQGFWLGDAHLAHIFLNQGEVTGFIDIDSIRINRPFMLKKPVKDIAGLNHPDLPLSDEEKETLLNYYLEKVKINDKKKFKRLLKYYTQRRWE